MRLFVSIPQGKFRLLEMFAGFHGTTELDAVAANARLTMYHGNCMTPSEVIRLRSVNHRIARASFKSPGDVVAWFGAVQAQDYLGSLWAIGLRMEQATEATVEAAEAKRTIIRTWPMRGTLHFVTPVDARWLLQLLTPRVVARNASRLKKEVDVDDKVLARSRDLLVRALEGGKRLSREQLYSRLAAARIKTGNNRGLAILNGLAQEGTLCMAGREGKQQTLALLDEWVPESKHLERDEALAELARRYFTSHGPATLQDFMWWAGIAAKDAQAGIDCAKRHLIREVIAERAYWLAANAPATGPASPASAQTSIAKGADRTSRSQVIRVRRSRQARADDRFVSLLPAFDEYTVAYKDRDALLDEPCDRSVDTGMGLLNPLIVIAGRIVGTWKRKLAKGAVRVETQLFRSLSKREDAGLARAIERYSAFLDLEASRTAASSISSSSEP